MFNGKSSAKFVTLCFIRLELFKEMPATAISHSTNQKKTKTKGREKVTDCRQVTRVKIETFECLQNDEDSDSNKLEDGSETTTTTSLTNQQSMVPKKYRKSRRRPKSTLNQTATTTATSDQTQFGKSLIETTFGIIHLYKENLLSEVSESKILCLLSIPATVSCNDLLSFTGPCHETISHIRVLKETLPNQYMALITFRSHKYAMEFYETFNGTPFTSLEPEHICRAIWVSGVDVSETNQPPPANHTELPICAVCLERMDESIDGVLTILCNHTFHTDCLIKWADLTCPICRCAQSPEAIESSECMVCGRNSMENDPLWICLICGHVGCHRYCGGHAADHYKESGHCYALQLGSDRVWDYKGDNFVHRLIQNKSDGKLVASEQPPQATNYENSVDEEKVFSIQLEFSHLLTTQLEAQRKYFQGVINDLECTINTHNETIKSQAKTIRSMENKLNCVNKEKNNSDKKSAQLQAKLKATVAELNEEKSLGKALRQNQVEWNKKFDNVQEDFVRMKKISEEEISNLKEQLRDIMFYFEAQNTIGNMENSEEIRNGRIEVGPASSSSSSSTNTNEKQQSQKQRRKR